MSYSDSSYSSQSSSSESVQRRSDTPSGLPYQGPAKQKHHIASMTEDVRLKPERGPEPQKQYTLTYSSLSSINIENWVSALTGCQDADLLDSDVRRDVIVLKEMHEVPGLKRQVPHLLIHNIATEADTDAGMMVLASVKELQEAARDVAARNPGPVVKPILFIDGRKDQESLMNVDVSVLQCAKENEHCMFQAASNFNGVECISERSSPDTPNFTTSYYFDHTQGPAASISAGPAAIARVHGAFYDPKKDASTWGQTSKRQIEMLGDVSEYYNVINGYVCNSKDTKALPKDPHMVKEIEDRVKVLVHADIDALYGRYDYASIERCKPQKICQTFCAAMNLSQGMSGQRNRGLPDSAEKAKLLLRAAYRGTFYGAEMYGCRKVYLTLIGGGVFGNNQDDIMDAICSAHAELCEFNKVIEEIHIVFFRPPTVGPLLDVISKYPIIPWRVWTFTRGKPMLVKSSDDKKK